MSFQRILSTVALAALALGGCGGEDFGIDYSGADGPPVDPQVASQGAEIYAMLCGACHGADGSGSAIYLASIQGARGIAGIVRNGADGMPANDLGDPEISSIEAFLAVQAGAPTMAPGAGGPVGQPAPDPTIDPPPMVEGDPLVAQGQAIYAQLCGACHGADASGGAAYRRSIQGARGISGIVRRGADGMPANNLDDQQMAALEAFLGSFVGGGATPAAGQGGYAGGEADEDGEFDEGEEEDDD